MKKVLLFGTFDPLHEGHIHLFGAARELGDYLIVVVTRDAVIRERKHRDEHQDEKNRLRAVREVDSVDEALLGDENPAEYALLDELGYDVLALGYDQQPDDDEVRALLDSRGKSEVEIVRLYPYRPDEFKSSLLRS